MSTSLMDELSSRLHRGFDAVLPSAELRGRLLAAGMIVDERIAAAGPPRVGRLRWLRRRPQAAMLAVVSAVAAIVVSAVLVTTTTVEAPVIAVGPSTDPAAVCADPRTSFARFWFIGNNDESIYQGTVLVGSARVPSLSMYISSGPPGIGVMCISAEAKATVPIQSMAQARSRPIGYTGTAGGTLYFAVGPGVVRATVDAGGTIGTYTLDATGEIQLQPFGDGWHAVGTGHGSSARSFVVRAYNSSGALVDTVVQEMQGPPPSSSSPPSS